MYFPFIQLNLVKNKDMKLLSIVHYLLLVGLVILKEIVMETKCLRFLKPYFVA